MSDDELISDFEERIKAEIEKGKDFKSISTSINHLIKSKLEQIDGWQSEVFIFNEESYRDTTWRLDFACEDGFAVEIAFNHGEAISWNQMKPVLSSELNHVRKAIQTKVGISMLMLNLLL